MYKAKIESIEEQVNDTVNVQVTFYKEEKKMTKSFNFHASNFKSTEDIKKFIKGECENLDNFTSVVELIKPLVGLDDVVTEL